LRLIQISISHEQELGDGHERENGMEDANPRREILAMVAALEMTEEVPATPILGSYILEPRIVQALSREEMRLRV
jgi:hypothetical protein